MDLSAEDSLRLNVMLANAVAVRIDEGTNVVHCLSENGNEAKVQLNPNCRSEQYIRKVRELLSSNVLGSPGGYPVFLKRWTRMGQANDARLADLLMLGEPEAVVAVSGAPMLTDALAERAWWAMPDSDNARRMLHRESVVSGKMGRVLAEFLLEFLPFEQEPRDIIESVKLVLQPGLISEEQKMDIWRRGQQKNVFLVGFLHALADSLPDQHAPRSDLDQHREKLETLNKQGNEYAAMLLRMLSGPGQTYINASSKILKKPTNQDVVVSFLEATEKYFSPFRLSPYAYENVDSIVQEVNKVFAGETSEMTLPENLEEVIREFDSLTEELKALMVLAHLGEPVIRPIFSRTDSVGSVMRRKIEPVSKPIQTQLDLLKGMQA